MRVSKHWRWVVLPVLTVIAAFGFVSRRYIVLYFSRKPAPLAAFADPLENPAESRNPQILLAEANRLAWLFNWPKADLLCVRAKELFKETGETRNEVCARVGRIRAQSETTMSRVREAVLSRILGDFAKM